MNTPQEFRLPGFTAESSMASARPFRGRNSSSPNLGAEVEPAGSDVTCNCGCPCAGSIGSTGSTGSTGGPPGNCQCSTSNVFLNCLISADNCNPGFVPSCDCSFFGISSCRCVPSTQ